MVATRRGQKLEDPRPRDPSAMLAGVDAVITDNRFPDFVQPICQAVRARGSSCRRGVV